MAINLASKYEKKVAERYKRESLTDGGAGHDYDFTGVNEITVYSINTVPLTNYTRSGTARFGTLNELEDTKQTMQMAMDRAFTFSIDAGNAAEQFNIKQANACLKREIDEVITPEIDTYRLKAWAWGKGLSSGKTIQYKTAGAALTKANILDELFSAKAQMHEKNVTGAVTCYIPELEYVKCKLADVVIGGSQLNKEAVQRGYKGEIDEMKMIAVPSSRWPANFDPTNPASGTSKKKLNFLLKAPGTSVDPFKLKNYRVHKNPMGVDGDVVEGRIMYDSFVLDAKCDGILADMI